MNTYEIYEYFPSVNKDRCYYIMIFPKKIVAYELYGWWLFFCETFYVDVLRILYYLLCNTLGLQTAHLPVDQTCRC